ncbi:MAG: TRAP transporter small permease [Alphaproteobacteria bacterium]|nr:TRAP transporter small permease [Alphaproteobacteria bacterium]
MSRPARLLAMLDAALARVETGAAMVGGGLAVAAMLLTMAEVLGRRLFNAPVPGMIDLFDIGMAGMALLGTGYCQRLSGHIRMEMLISRLAGRARWVLEAATTGGAFVFIALIFTSSVEHAFKAWRLHDVTNEVLLPLWPSRAILSMALLLLVIRLGLNVVGYLRLVRRHTATPIAIPIPEGAAP